MTEDALLVRDVSRKLEYELFRYIIPVPVRGRGRRPTCGRVPAAAAGLWLLCAYAPAGRGSPPTDFDDASPGGSGNSESWSVAAAAAEADAMLLRSTGLSVDMDMDRTGAMTDVERERGGTMRDTAGVARAGTEEP